MAWEVVKKTGPGKAGRWLPLIEKPVVGVSVSGKTKSLTRNLLISPILMDLMKNPTHITVMTDGNGRIGLKASSAGDMQAYKVNANRKSQNSMAYISCSIIIIQLKLADGDYMEAEIDGDVLAINAKKRKNINY